MCILILDENSSEKLFTVSQNLLTYIVFCEQE